MDYIIYFCICICAVTVFAFYIVKSKGITEPYRPEEVKIKTEFDTEKFMAEVIDLSYREEMVGILTPKLVKSFTVVFKTDDNEKLKIEILRICTTALKWVNTAKSPLWKENCTALSVINYQISKAKHIDFARI